MRVLQTSLIPYMYIVIISKPLILSWGLRGGGGGTWTVYALVSVLK